MEQRFFCLRGYMKSGTNWLGGLLSTHREISVVGEFHFEDVVSSLNKTFNQNVIYAEVPGLREATRKQFDSLVKSTITKASISASGDDANIKLIGDRTPHAIEPITLRGAPHVVIVRDGRDVLVSRAFHLYNNPQAHRLFQRIPKMAETYEYFKSDPWFFKNHPDQLLCHEVMVRESGVFWSEHVAADRTATERHPHLPVCFVRYEDLHADAISERRRLFEFLGVDPDNCEDIKGRLKPGFEKERPDKFFRKGAVGDWKNYFTDDTTRWFNETAGQELKANGYA